LPSSTCLRGRPAVVTVIVVDAPDEMYVSFTS
jgi:hypothetical protein